MPGRVLTYQKVPWYLIVAVITGILLGSLLALEPFLLIKARLSGLVFPLWDHYIPIVSMGVVIFLILLSFFSKKILWARANRDEFLLIILFITPFCTGLSNILIHPTFYVLTILMAVWFVRGALDNRIDIVFNRSFIILILFFQCSCFSLLLGPNVEFVEMARLFFLIFPIFCLVNLVRSKNQLMKCFNYLFVIAFINCFIGLGQLFLFLTKGMVTTFAGETDQFTNSVFGLKIIRMAGFLVSPDHYANATSVFVLLSIYYLMFNRELSRNWRFFHISFCVLGLFVIFLCHVRMAWLGLILCFYLMPFIIKPKYSIHYALATLAVVAICLISGIIPELYKMVYGIRPESIVFRGAVNRLVWDVMLDYPLTGVGFTGIRYHFNPTDGLPHSTWLHLVSGAGVIASFFFLLYAISLLIRVINNIRIASGFTKSLYKGLFTGLVYFLIIALFSPDLFEKIFWFYCALLETTFFITGRSANELAGIRPLFGVV